MSPVYFLWQNVYLSDQKAREIDFSTQIISPGRILLIYESKVERVKPNTIIQKYCYLRFGKKIEINLNFSYFRKYMLSANIEYTHTHIVFYCFIVYRDTIKDH